MLGVGFVELLLVVVGDDVLVLECGCKGVLVDVLENFDLIWWSGCVCLDNVCVMIDDILFGVYELVLVCVCILLVVEVVGGVVDCVDSVVVYVKV